MPPTKLAAKWPTPPLSLNVAIVEDGEGRIQGQSCNHVTGMCNNPAELQAVAPGLLELEMRERVR